MENFVLIKTGLWIALAIAALLAIALVVYELRKAGSSASDTINSILDSVLGPRVVVTPKGVQHFIDEPANQAYVPWVPPVEDDETYPPAWLSKGDS